MSYASYNGGDENVDKENQAAPVEDCRLVVEEYRMMKKLGEGKFGKVVLAQHLQDKKCFVAIKIISKEYVLKRNILQTVENELKIMKQLDSPTFPTLIAVTQSAQNVYFIMENCVFGDFRSLLKDQNLGCLYQDEVPFYMDELMMGIQYLHKKDIIHQDLKLDNLLLTSDHHLKICDFGLSQTGVKENMKLHVFCGTMANMPPEKITHGWYTRLSDWWSYGIILLEMFGYNNPFFRDVKKDTCTAITTISKKFEKRVEAAPVIPEVALDLVNELLQYEDNRIHPNDIPNHKFFDELKRQKIENSPLNPPLLIPNLTRNTRHLGNSTEEVEPFRFAAFGGDDEFENFYYKRTKV
ncbi:unnamed protein product [Caenorhabditis brenneri]